MSRGGAVPAHRPTGWIYLRSRDCTIRWQRGDNMAYIFEGKQMKTYPDEPLRANVLTTIPVSSKGWIDLNQIKILGEKWAEAKRRRCQACGVIR